VIAGTLARSPGNPVGWLSSALGVFADAGPSDGTVAVAETPLPGMVDFATVPASHTWIMNEPAVRAMVVRFLAQGRLRGAGG
jgi:hypothetical protein